jgi:beta-glucosidase/6-phospho-beta-glucosidase/beta-galactosidase
MLDRRSLGQFALGLAIAAPLGCSSNGDVSAGHDAGDVADATLDAESDGGPILPSEVTFPKGFMWGTSTAAFQVEKGDSNTDWAAWVATPGKIADGGNPDIGGDDALAHIADDVGLITNESHNAYRFSIELARLFPTQAALDSATPDPTGLAAYDAVIAALRAANITPLVTLNHFALANWSDNVAEGGVPQGWELPETTTEFTKFCTFAAARWGKDVDWWVTINEPLSVVLGGYLNGSFPPGEVLTIDRGLNVFRAFVYAHAACYDAIKAADTIDADGDGKASMVSVAAALRTFHPLDPTDPSDVKATAHVKYLANDWFLNAVTSGNFDYDFDGTLTGPQDITGDPTLKGRLDYVGVNYYTDTIISGDQGFVIPAPISAALTLTDLPTTRPKTDFDWDIYPEGFGTVLDEAATYKLPIVVTENGVADQKDVMRGRFIAEHLLQLGAANLRGDDVLGYFHWSLLDNFEWASGYCPHFGLHSVDPVTAARTKRASADVYSSIIRAGKVTQAQIDAMPPYGAPTPCGD